MPNTAGRTGVTSTEAALTMNRVGAREMAFTDIVQLEKVCTKCNAQKPLAAFYRRARSRDGLSAGCRDCIKIENAKRYRDRYQGDGTRREQMRVAGRRWHHANKERRGPLIRDRERQLRDEVLAQYGGRCRCCGETKREFLSFDHVNGGGRKHRSEIGSGKIHRWLRKEGYPDGFRILCHNCNQALGAYGYCPHGGLVCAAE